MKISIKSNIYTNTLEETRKLFASYLCGQANGLILIVSFRRLNEKAVSALKNSFARLGYGRDACTFLMLAGSPPLSGKNLLAAIEGLDPLLLVISDAQAVAACSDAYRQPIEPHKRGRLFGREVRAFRAFASMLEDPREKQQAWAMLKTLPKLYNHFPHKDGRCTKAIKEPVP